MLPPSSLRPPVLPPLPLVPPEMPRIDLKNGSLPVVVGDPSDPNGMAAHFSSFIEWLRMKGYSEQTVHNACVATAQFARWCSERGVTKSMEK